MKQALWYWEHMSSPHKMGMLEALTERGYAVTYVVQREVTPDRASLGWSAPVMRAGTLRVVDPRAPLDIATEVPAGAIHICDGIRANGALVTRARRELRRRGLRFWVFIEQVDDDGLRGLLKRIEYRRLLYVWRDHLAGVLATGGRCTDWVTARGFPAQRTFPFAYFLPTPGAAAPAAPATSARTTFRFLFVGQLIARKRIDLLMDALASLADTASFELVVVGDGPLASALRGQADRNGIATRTIWAGVLPMDQVGALMADADCLVLPSRHDGWGAVVSEALMSGTPVVCSDRCGAAVAVASSRCGGVFKSGDATDLAHLLARTLATGRVTSVRRAALARWATCLNATAGAQYLDRILSGQPCEPPWAGPREPGTASRAHGYAQ